MDKNRRNFLKITGCAAVGAAWGVPVIRAIEKAFEVEPLPQGLIAKRWALVVDTQKCLDPVVRKVAQQACHRAHNVPANHIIQEEEVKWIWEEKFENAFPGEVHDYSDEQQKEKPVLVLCNHCDRAPCVRVCPTQATWKRKDGIVMMDMHRCIGCRYCMAACPYGSRSFNFSEPFGQGETRQKLLAQSSSSFPSRSKGVVEKCNFCAERLAKGQQPACVEAVNGLENGTGALVFGDLGDPNSEVANILRQRHGLRRKPNLGTAPQVYYLT